MLDDAYRYAASYWRHFRRGFETDSSLRSLVRSMRSQEDAAMLAGPAYYVGTERGWEPADAAEVAAYIAEINAEYELRWKVIIFGPDGSRGVHSRHPDETSAREVAEQLPSRLRAVAWCGDGWPTPAD